MTQLNFGSIIVTTDQCTPSSIITLTYLEPINQPGILSVSNITTGSFQINSNNASDISYVQWFLVNYEGSTIPTVSTTSIDPGFNSFTGYGNVNSSGYSTVTEAGFIWSESNNNPTFDSYDGYQSASLPFGLGEFSVNWYWANYGHGPSLWARAYAINANGTSYGIAIEGTLVPCLAKGTLITLANGSQKLIENIDYTDLLAVWNFDEGKLDSAYPLWIKKPSVAHEFNVITFDNGAQLKSLKPLLGHRILNMETGKFAYPMTNDFPIGTLTYSLDGPVKLLDKKIISETLEYYNIITNYHINLFANGILTSCRYNNIYPIQDMKFVKTNILNISKESYNLSDAYFYGMRLSEQSTPVSETIKYIKAREAIKLERL